MKRGENLRKHGLTGTPEHRSWLSMITRCYGSDPSRGDFHLYQGAGVQVCHRWRESFLNFLADMGPKPSNRHSIERIDSRGDYELANCRWATPKEQARNTSRNRRISHRGITLTLVEWSERTGLKREVIADRLNRGWSVKRALTTQLTTSRNRNKMGRYV